MWVSLEDLKMAILAYSQVFWVCIGQNFNSNSAMVFQKTLENIKGRGAQNSYFWPTDKFLGSKQVRIQPGIQPWCLKN